ncbi:MAG: helix-turn-helix domain-containing protein [Blastocatellia bacterium]|nr:helix-turn-helix domain-containing protein [Blastocatellia bacterium]
MPSTDFFSILECAEFLGVSQAEVESLVSDKVLKSFQIGKEVMISHRQAEMWKTGLLRRPGKKKVLFPDPKP